jgi:hypothetical protein
MLLIASLFSAAIVVRKSSPPATQTGWDNFPDMSGTAPMTTGYREL